MSPDTTTLSERLSGYLRTLEEDGRIRSRWVPGMEWLWHDGFRWNSTRITLPAVGEWMTMPVVVPSIGDRITVLGALLLFREASGDDGAHTYRVAPGCWEVRWRVLGSTEQRTVGGGVTEAHALVNAFEVLVNEIQR